MSYLQTTGRIFDVQRYSIHDGPGIRTIVFLKGCVLRCRWCCNPESQEYGIQTMKVLGKDKVIGRDVTVEEMIKVVEQDRPYYRRSGGGLTLSGGESLCQPEFARDLLRAAKERGINTALESMACAPFETIETILPYLDLYLMDIKHTNPAKHKEFTGRPNELMMENARKVALSGKCKLIIRVPVIPTFNDTVEEMIKVVEQDRPYYRRSGGGLTLSGGESLCQPEFARDMLRAAKERGINTALESMACAPFETIETILPYLDLYLMDIKHTNPAKHKEFTGRANDLMMENARKVALSGKCKLIIRVPVIPTFNDTVEEIQGIASFADTLPGVEQLHLLPYHRLGQDKYIGLGRPYLMEGILPPTQEHMQTLKKAAESVSSLHVQIGG